MIVRIENPLYGGSFRTDQADVLRYVLTGERLETGQVVDSTSVTVVESSPRRVLPGCAHFGACGGCDYQHSDYANQIAIKREILCDTLARAGLQNLPAVRPHFAEPWGYRNRIRLRFEPLGDGRGVRPGYSRRNSNDFLPIAMCPIGAPLLWQAIEALVALAGDDSSPGRWLRDVAEVELFCNPDASRLQMQFFLRDAHVARAEPQAFVVLCERLQSRVPQLSAAGAEFAPALDRRTRRNWPGQAWGASGIAYDTAHQSYWVSRGAFFQVNRHLVDRLVDLVTAHAASGALAWDLFAGVGLFTLELASRYEQVVAVEAGDAAAADLLRASRRGKSARGFTAVHSTTLDFLRAQQNQRERPELVVLDPPRAGLGVDAATILAGIAPPRIVYVSCDPVTLARDLAVLTRFGYRIETIDLIDLFPQTFHLETVVHLARCGAS